MYCIAVAIVNWILQDLQSVFFTGQMVYSVRMQCGRVLAREAWIKADIVSSVPESGTAAAHGFSREVRELLLLLLLHKCHTVGINIVSQICHQFLSRDK